MYCHKAHDSLRVLSATCVSLGIVGLFFGILPFVNRINIKLSARSGESMSAMTTAPARRIELAGMPTLVQTKSVSLPAAVEGVPVEKEPPTIPLRTIQAPVLEPAKLDQVSKRAFEFEVSDLDFVPMPIHRIPPAYPWSLKQQGIEGRAFVEFRVDEQGRVFDIVVMEATHPEFGDAVVEAVARWRFVPGQMDGKAVRFRMRLPVNFRLIEQRAPMTVANHE